MRTIIQNKLNEIKSIDCGELISDDIIEDNITYFGYQVNKTFVNSDFDHNYTYRVSLTGYITRRVQSTENTTQIVDNASDKVMEKLKELNFKCNTEDVSIENNIKKIKISGNATYNEINNKLL